MKIRVFHVMKEGPPLPGAVLVAEATDQCSPIWEIEIRDLEHLMELAQDATIAFIRPAFRPTRRKKARGSPEFGDVSLLVDHPGKHFQQR